jgi:hypothetical protein
VHKISDTVITISNLIFFILLGLTLTVGAIYLGEKRVKDIALHYSGKHDNEISRSEINTLLSFYSLHLLMNKASSDIKARLMLNGIFANHLETCKSSNCGCQNPIMEFEKKVQQKIVSEWKDWEFEQIKRNPLKRKQYQMSKLRRSF